MVVLKRIGVLSIAKLNAIIMAIIGLIAGIFLAIFASVIKTMTDAGEYATQTGNLATLGWIGIIVLPIFYGILGFVGGAAGAWLYNLIARWVGGIELELSK